MKNLVLLITFTITWCFSSGQTNIYHPFPDANAAWVETSWFVDPWACLNYDDHNLTISGDTTIGSFTYHKLYRNGWVTIFCPPNSPPPYYYAPEYWGAFRQDSANKRVYLNFGTDTLAYDFNLNVGDTLPPSCLYWFNYVVSIDSVLVGSQYHKRFWLSNGNSDNYAALIEGIGSTFGAFSRIESPFESGSTLRCVKINDQTVWNYDTTSPCNLISKIDDIKIQVQTLIYPNPFSESAIIKINKNLKNADLTMYNTLGQEMRRITNISGPSIILERGNLPGGIYYLVLSQENTIIMRNKILIK
jgi:hypothetical protein